MVAAHGQNQFFRLRICLVRLVPRHSALILKCFTSSVTFQPLVASPPCDLKFSAQGAEITPCFVCAYYKCSSLIFHSFLFPRHQTISSLDAFLPSFYHETVYHLSEHSVYYLTGPYTGWPPGNAAFNGKTRAYKEGKRGLYFVPFKINPQWQPCGSTFCRRGGRYRPPPAAPSR